MGADSFLELFFLARSGWDDTGEGGVRPAVELSLAMESAERGSLCVDEQRRVAGCWWGQGGVALLLVSRFENSVEGMKE